ncbi:MAG TPA: HDIG domain-containing protein [Thermomicrobiaceae bacterium]|nr:HDIG domain-containing protein [Thermomicrobiaceae bacterium]
MISTGRGASGNQISQVQHLAGRFGLRQPVAWRVFSFAMLGLAILAILSGTLYLTWQSDSLNLKAGEIATRTIKSPATDTFVSALRTADARQEAYDDARNVVLLPDASVAPAQVAALQKALLQIDEVRAPAFGTPTAQGQNDQIRAAVEGLSADDATAIAALDSSAWSRVKNEAQRLLSVALADQVRQEDVASIKQGLLDRSLLISASERSLAVALATPFIRANVQVDQDQTKAAREAAAKNVEPVMVTVQQGQVIVRDGDPVTSYDIEKLEHFGLLTATHNWPQFVGTLGLLAIVTLALLGYLFLTASGTGDLRQLLLVSLIVVVPVVTGRFLLQSDQLRLMFPAAAAAMLLSILLDFQLAVVLAGFLALYLGIVSGSTFEVALLTFISSLTGAVIVYRAERIVRFFWAALGVGLAVFVTAVCLTLTNGHVDASKVGQLAGDAAVNGAVSASLTFLFFYMLGRVFGIVTHLQLLELAHPNQPLLYRLAREAPGTYHHSIVVSNLAESAVEAVGGDPLFARTACLYHDIGKVLRPSFFVENQANRANVHDALDPRTSARIIQEHVEDGVRLARKARLPQPIIDVIQQHHGTTLIKYFYAEALASGEPVDEDEFRYKGPKPQTKEAAIIMLADSVEAAVRAASQSGKLYEEANGDGRRASTGLKEVVDGVIKARLEDRQLDDCDLTLRQIEQIRATFITMLEGIYHPRVEYPELSKTPTRQPVEAAH